MIVIPVKTVSGMNAREHHMARSRRVKGERTATSWALCQTAPPVPPCTVKLTRLAPSNGLDKTRAIELAESGASPHQIGAWTGHESLAEIAHYTQAAERRRAVMGTEREGNVGKPAIPVGKR